MKPSHKMCGSTDLDTIVVAKGKKLEVYDVCKHCQRIVEKYEIDDKYVKFDRVVSKFSMDSSDAMEHGKMIVASLKHKS